jgi:hypothetical protein
MSIYDLDWDYARRVGNGNASRGFRRMIGYTRSIRHKLAGIQNAHALTSAVFEARGDRESARLLQDLHRQLERFIQDAEQSHA